jgi:glycosyltransferase involved in cell wall biosynthesis
MKNKYNNVAINWYGDITSISGNSIYARNLIKELILNGASVRIFPIQPQAPVARLEPWWEQNLNLLINSNHGFLDIYHGNPSGFDRSIKSSNQSVILTHWETNTVPVSWVNIINNSYDNICVTNKGTYNTIEESITIPKYYCRPGLELETLSSDKLSIVGVNDNTLIFGAIGIWNNRKNFSDLVIAYTSEFIENDNVCLVIKTMGSSPGDPNEKVRIINLVRELRKSINNPLPPPIVLLQDVYSYETLNNLLNRFDIFVSSSRGESKSFSLLSCMFKGKPCIIPNDNHIQGELVKLNENYKSEILYSYNAVSEPVIQMGNYYNSRDNWARPNTTDLANKMKQAYCDALSKDLSLESAKLKQLITDKYDIKLTAKQFVENYKDILKDTLISI